MKVGIAHSHGGNYFQAGKSAGEKAMKRGHISTPDLVFAFCNSQVDPYEFFGGLKSAVGENTPVVGGSAIGVITQDFLSYEGSPAAVAVIESERIRFRVAVAGGLGKGERSAGAALAEAFLRAEGNLLTIFYDSVRTPATQEAPPVLNASTPLIEGIEGVLGLDTPILGAGLIGDYQFGPTKQFCGSQVKDQSAVGVMMEGEFTPYFRIMHGCTPLNGCYHTITAMEGAEIYELDHRPIVEMIDELYGDQEWHHEHPVKILTLGINHGKRFEKPGESNYVNRLITGILPDGRGIGIFEPDLEPGVEIQFMLRDSEKMVESARDNSRELLATIRADGKKPLFALYIDCAGRAAGYLNTLTEEAWEIRKILGRYSVPFLGFYSGVEIAPLLGKSRGLDWTGVLVILAGE